MEYNNKMTGLKLIFGLCVWYSFHLFLVQGAVTTESMVYWPNATVPFYINSEHYDEQQTQTIIRALDRFNQLTCVKFVPVFSLSTNIRVLHVNNPTGMRKCLFKTKSFVDRPHNMVVGYDCLTAPAIDTFIMKSLGFNFEHNRPGRDIFISVLVENIEPGSIELYTKDIELPAELRELAYDYNSVMHFNERDHSKNGHRTILFKNKAMRQNRKTLTATDLRKIEIVYGPHCRLRERNDQIHACNKFVPTDGKERRRRHAGNQHRYTTKGVMRTRLFFKERRVLESSELMEATQTNRPTRVHVRTTRYGTTGATDESEEKEETTSEPVSMKQESNKTIEEENLSNIILIGNSSDLDQNETINRRIATKSRYKSFFKRFIKSRNPSTSTDQDSETNHDKNVGFDSEEKNVTHTVTTVDPPFNRPWTTVDMPRKRPRTTIDPPERDESPIEKPSTTIDLPEQTESPTEHPVWSPGEELSTLMDEDKHSEDLTLPFRKKRGEGGRPKARVRRADASEQQPLYQGLEYWDDISLSRGPRSEVKIAYDRINMTDENKKYYRDRIWSGRVVPYVIADNGFDRHLVRKRLNEVNQILKHKTCVKLREYSLADVATIKDYLVIDTTKHFEPGRVGGKQHFGAPELFLKGQPRQLPAMMVMSMLGFNFECARHDRDDFVAVYYNNIIEGKEGHFERMPEAATLRLPYDYSSASHPGWKFWRKPLIHNRSTVATLKRTDPDTRIMRNLGENEKILSIYDIQKINTVYNCVEQQNLEYELK